MDMTEQNNTNIAERVDAQTQTDTSTAEDLTLAQKLTPIAHHELQLESAAQLSPPPPPPTSSTTTPHTPLDKFDKDILRWKDVHFLRDFGDWFNPEKAVQPTYTRLLSSCGYYGPDSPLDLVEDHIPPVDFVEDHKNSPPLDLDLVEGDSLPLNLEFVENSDTSILTQTQTLSSPGNDTNVERGVGQWFSTKSGDAIVVEHTDTPTAALTDIDTMTSTQTARSPTVTVRPISNAVNVGDNPDSDLDPTILVESRTN